MEGVISQRTGKGWLAWRRTKDSKDIFGLKMYEQVNWQMIKSLSNRFWSQWCSAQGLLHEHTHKMYEEKPMKFTLALYKNNNPHLKVLLTFFFARVIVKVICDVFIAICIDNVNLEIKIYGCEKLPEFVTLTVSCWTFSIITKNTGGNTETCNIS